MKCRTCGTTLSAGALLCGECGTSAIAPRPTLGDTERYDRRALLDAIANEGARRAAPAGPAPSRSALPQLEPESEPEPQSRELQSHAPQHQEPQHAAVPAPRGALFSLVFSTGESIRVSGSGLIGRNPVVAPEERVDYLVQIVDPERSVSKTHLAFGVDEDTLWIADRGSANGTRFNLDLLEPIELVPGERMRVPRGTRIGIGDQYFDVH